MDINSVNLYIFLLEASSCERCLRLDNHGETLLVYGDFHTREGAKAVYSFCRRLFSATKAIELRNIYGSGSSSAIRSQTEVWERGAWTQKV